MTKTKPPISPARYCLVEDDDGHWYVIPLVHRASWETYLQCDTLPDWATQIDGPHRLSFTDWVENEA